jgi:uncharacterized phage-like protein YoqJ
MILSITGHRPNKIGGYKNEIFSALAGFAMKSLQGIKPDKVITGMALGWDQAVAWACINLNIPYIAAIPCYGQEKVWQKRYQIAYKLLKDYASEVVVVTKHPYAFAGRDCMQKRNVWMVDNSDGLLALWNGSHGGTKNCIDYATNVEKPIINLWDNWIKFWEGECFGI